MRQLFTRIFRLPEKAVSAEIAALRKIIDDCVILESQAAQVVQGLDELEKRLQRQAVGEVGKGPKYRRDTATNLINRIQAAHSEGIHRNGHGAWLAFHAEKAGIVFEYSAPASPALAA